MADLHEYLADVKITATVRATVASRAEFELMILDMMDQQGMSFRDGRGNHAFFELGVERIQGGALDMTIVEIDGEA
jgi:hypothetical protein